MPRSPDATQEAKRRVASPRRDEPLSRAALAQGGSVKRGVASGRRALERLQHRRRPSNRPEIGLSWRLDSRHGCRMSPPPSMRRSGAPGMGCHCTTKNPTYFSTSIRHFVVPLRCWPCHTVRSAKLEDGS